VEQASVVARGHFAVQLTGDEGAAREPTRRMSDILPSNYAMAAAIALSRYSAMPSECQYPARSTANSTR
jgi:hypothetical protein